MFQTPSILPFKIYNYASICDVLFLCFSIGTKTMCPSMYKLTLASIPLKTDMGCTHWRLARKGILDNLTNNLRWNVTVGWDLQSINISLGDIKIRDIKFTHLRCMVSAKCWSSSGFPQQSICHLLKWIIYL